MTKHLVPALGNIPLAKLQPMHLQQYYSRALKEGRRDGKGGLSTRTVRYHHTVHPKVVQERLGHESITITMDTYSHILPGLQEEAMKKFDEAMHSNKNSKQNYNV